MEKLTNIIEAILFASGKSVPIAEIMDKLVISKSELNKALAELEEKYDSEAGIQLLRFNGKVQLGSNPLYKDEVASVLNPIREKELTRTILETAAIIAYKQPITKTEIEMMRGLNSDYAVRALLELKMIYPCGRKDAIGKPILYATTDEFLKRFKLQSLEDLPDYDALMEAIARPVDDEKDSYLYTRDRDSLSPEEFSEGSTEEKPRKEEKDVGSGYDIPDFLSGLDDAEIIKID